MKTLLKISSALLLLPAIAMAFQQGPVQPYRVTGKIISTPNPTLADGIQISNGKFQVDYNVGDQKVVYFRASLVSNCMCTFIFNTTLDQMTTITGSTNTGVGCQPGPNNQYTKAVCTVDGNVSSSSKDPNYSPTLKVDIE